MADKFQLTIDLYAGDRKTRLAAATVARHRAYQIIGELVESRSISLTAADFVDEKGLVELYIPSGLTLGYTLYRIEEK